MSGRIFIDTNVLVYSYSNDDLIKKAQALVTLQIPDAWLSTQVLIEFANIYHRKLKVDWPTVGVAVVELSRDFSVHPTTPPPLPMPRAWRSATAFRGLMRSSWPPRSNAAATRFIRKI